MRSGAPGALRAARGVRAGRSGVSEQDAWSWGACATFFVQAEDGIRDYKVTGVQTCALPIWVVSAAVAMVRCPGGVLGVSAGLGQACAVRVGLLHGDVIPGAWVLRHVLPGAFQGIGPFRLSASYRAGGAGGGGFELFAEGQGAVVSRGGVGGRAGSAGRAAGAGVRERRGAVAGYAGEESRGVVGARQPGLDPGVATEVRRGA